VTAKGSDPYGAYIFFIGGIYIAKFILLVECIYQIVQMFPNPYPGP